MLEKQHFTYLFSKIRKSDFSKYCTWLDVSYRGNVFTIRFDYFNKCWSCSELLDTFGTFSNLKTAIISYFKG